MNELKFTDEQLAAYIEHALPADECDSIDSAMDIDTLEVISASRKAVDSFVPDNIISLPSWNDISALNIPQDSQPLAMCGFLGDEDEPDASVDTTIEDHVPDDDIK